MDGRHDFAMHDTPEGPKAILQMDLGAARKTVENIRVLERECGAHVALAHDERWLVEGEDAVLMSLLDEPTRRAAKTQIPRGEVIP